jgi:hypothetical protein
MMTRPSSAKLEVFFGFAFLAGFSFFAGADFFAFFSSFAGFLAVFFAKLTFSSGHRHVLKHYLLFRFPSFLNLVFEVELVNSA